ncbi:bifunctional glutamate N-acetyltransferase/amino-acid acetyltransferase ArgJ [Candidatus Nitrosacidococcus tergens]|uniref:Arginine biosynthesis bifunctional protein ArgJ n=1 Tax=Candidatus Nitrosacidococcus tergens TaxID=553981 RepID=A0A7G1QAT9_9GAMM|nr:bifunctional glutamate N-acetyltransferase/amino-acid acetyltransferase ArgJ [Candidatus Nitrosacidococcus tergens]CAB1276911.1 Arginine biosynthesis bifunctional protein ArgJ [Candidatus Nitrosacidococcus tergens]
MAVGLSQLSKLIPIKGIELGAIASGIRYQNRLDLVVIKASKESSCAAVFTRNAFCAAPVTLARTHLAQTSPHLLLINSGNANAGTGTQGLVDTKTCCTTLAQLDHTEITQVLPFSTGVIGIPLPVAVIQAGIPKLWNNLSPAGWEVAARGIMTTDTVPKGVSAQCTLQGHTVTITGIAKGSGMIRPDMATMLAFLATDVKIPKSLLQTCLNQAVEESFNRITVDGDTSTNDACVLLATGKKPAVIKSIDSQDFIIFRQTLTQVCQYLAQAIVRDGEGATKFIIIEVVEGATTQECTQVAYTIAHSPLVKTAFFASDPNWGRILAAIGRSDIPNLDVNKVSFYLNDLCVIGQGIIDPEYSEEKGQKVMKAEEITIKVVLGRGKMSSQIWTCDFSYDYVKINAEYRS